MNLTLHEVADAVKAQNDVLKYEDQVLGNIEFDSRLIKPGDIFLPLKGARDGHDFIPTAFENGALVTFSEQKVAFPHILVENTEQAFQDLASYYLDKTAVDVIAITGSNGKTTTKDMIAQILATTYKTYKTQGNYNNEIGLPYTVLHMPDDTEKLVLEMGQDHMGDIHLLSTLAKPKLAVITLIGESHLEFFGTREKIAEGKMQIIDGLVHGGELIAPADKIINAYLPNNQKITRFGADADIHLTALYEHKDHLSFTVNFLDEDLTIPVPGKFNATNAMVAAYVGTLEGVSPQHIKKALANLNLTKNRVEWLKASNGADILSDVYNANPTAMRLILETFQTIAGNPDGRKIAVLADMKELGEQTAQLHAEMMTALNPEKLDLLYLYGENMLSLAQLAQEIFPPETVKYFRKDDEKDEHDKLSQALLNELKPADQVLLKGSHSMRLTEIVNQL
ncbi:MAG: UDP-N-acetylmuramoyl-tripeptide--D-alanyl-D-alanine ligase [Lactococcus chungangensis]|jgi:UDP-N-acetylmuramoyl-tripeptide--D-alanyl-D-alanine ligase|uniref:UDP-N-acetylmuramoyl-tripeptide--D-alanyl-D-alanine ligase n=2 Tax=Pseudolactococcus chungangensis TaxID=451457 RepID=A0A1K2H5R7_9LACT|nr:UDP-N-acetylmuramoyl-tripeptide--D-alanyl-D-alanine ligase [Lactococcus chungangensis]NCB81307.1 UDP-N-acetylmuramoyl-tripeptide--D-alanyl-D-alanine ligase [Bacilli bacterium]MDD3015667.1 UDP-N-acetylmuramoyl-tripeptide--D-alanyl-D-alanine ligase [Lactococcus chungangensis]NLH34610.1 UDP-N-acetylmuramoyl-tripeptide--D-alanyl-D-alanine ligase [Lactococcus chungangensis]PCS04581.1 UDP-N-acetylmuramoyl-tripeptide--D-alanyl-D-alanine ligase [Lactococcus chungangensis CAU 28 = DSM 22330]SFZ71570